MKEDLFMKKVLKLTVRMYCPVWSNKTQYTADRWPKVRRKRTCFENVFGGIKYVLWAGPDNSRPIRTFTIKQ